MKRLGLIALLLIIVICSRAEAFPIRPAYELTGKGTHVTTVNNCEIVFWGETQDGDPDIYAQKFNANGLSLWPEPLCLVSGDCIHEPCGAILTSDNNILFYWVQYRYDRWYEIRAQKITSNGQRLWSDGGVAISMPNNDLCRIKAVANDTGGAFFAWQMVNYQHFWFQDIDGWGNLMLEEGGRDFYLSLFFELGDIFPDGEGGILLKFSRTEDSLIKDNLIHISSSGNIIGGFPLLPAGFFPEERFAIIQDADGDFLIYCAERGNSHQLRIAKIDAYGVSQWAQDLIYPFTESEDAQDLSLALYPDGSYAAIWRRGLSAQRHWRMQRFDADFSPLWPYPGIDVATTSSFEPSLKLAFTDDQCLWLLWNTQDPVTQAIETRFQAVRPNAELVWEQEGWLLAQNTVYHSMSALGYNCLFFWESTQDGYISLRRDMAQSNGWTYIHPLDQAYVSILSGTAKNSKTVSVGGKILTFWNDTRHSLSRIYYQISDATNDALLSIYGKPLYPEETENVFIADAVKVDANTTALLFYEYFPNGARKYYLQLIDTQGNTFYADRGFAVAGQRYLDDMAIGTLDGEIYLLWKQGSQSQKQLYAQRIVSGQPMWGNVGQKIVALGANNSAEELIVRGRYFIWVNYNSHTDHIRSKVILLDENGFLAPGWSAEGFSILLGPNTEPNFLRNASVMDGDLIVIIEWYNYSTMKGDVRAQRISSSQERLWTPGGIPLWYNIQARNYYDSVFDEDTVVCVVGGFDDSQYGYRLHKLNLSGEKLWGDDGVFVACVPHAFEKALVARFEDGSTACVFSSSQGSVYDAEDIYVRHFSSEGQPLGELKALCQEPYPQKLGSLAVLENQAIVCWNDDRAGIYTGYRLHTGIWGCRIYSTASGASDPTQSPTADICLTRSYPNPFTNSTHISLQLKTPQIVSLNIYNIKGQLIRRLTTNHSYNAGSHEIEWDGKDERGARLSSGIYFCRASSSKNTTTIKLVMWR